MAQNPTVIRAGTGITVSPSNGVGIVTISATNSGGGFNGTNQFLVSTNGAIICTNSIGSGISIRPYDVAEGGPRISFGSTNGAGAYIQLRNTSVPQWQFSGPNGELMTMSQGSTTYVNNNGYGGWQVTANGQILMDGRGGANILLYPVTSGFLQVLGSTHLDGSTFGSSLTLSNTLAVAGMTTVSNLTRQGAVIPTLYQVVPSASTTNIIDVAGGEDFHINLTGTNLYIGFTNTAVPGYGYTRQRILLSIRQSATTNVNTFFLPMCNTNVVAYTNLSPGKIGYYGFLFNGPSTNYNLVAWKGGYN
jgi:hypothetical protein